MQVSNQARSRYNRRPSKRVTERIPRSLNPSTDVITKRFTIGNQTITTSAFAIVNVTTNVQSDQCSQFPSTEWASYAARYQQYRVKSFKVTFFPTQVVNTIATNFIGVLYTSKFISTNIPTSAAMIIADNESRCFSTNKQFSYTCTWDRNPNAKLWSPTNAAIAADRRYGIAWCSNTNVNILQANSILFVYNQEFEVELEGPT
jgi:hypothetical protein